MAVLLRGVTSDKYASAPIVDFRNLGAANAVNKVVSTAIPPGQGITVDNSQPYPVTGWIEVQWARFDGYIRLRSAWKTDQCVNTQSGSVTAGTIDPGEWSADWQLETPPTTNGDPAGKIVYWIRNRWHPDERLNIESGKLASSAAQDSWLSARWTFEPIAGTDQYQIRNVWQPAQYLNIETGTLVAGPIQPGWLSARWTTEQVV